MQYESSNTPEDAKSTFQERLQPIKDSATSACNTISQKTCGMCDCANDAIRKNPLAAVFGAAVFGAAVCYLILEGRHEPTFRERYIDGRLSDAGDSVSSSLRSAFDNLKFW